VHKSQYCVTSGTQEPALTSKPVAHLAQVGVASLQEATAHLSVRGQGVVVVGAGQAEVGATHMAPALTQKEEAPVEP